MGDRLQELWAWSRVPLGWAIGSRVAIEVLAVPWLMWIGPAKPIVLPGRPFVDPWFRWDANWYLQIAHAGIEQERVLAVLSLELQRVHAVDERRRCLRGVRSRRIDEPLEGLDQARRDGEASGVLHGVSGPPSQTQLRT